MKISGVEMFPVINPTPLVGGRVWMFLRLDTDDGTSGYGELAVNALPWRPTVTAEMVRNVVDDLLIGHEVADVELLYLKLYNDAGYSHASDLTKSAIISGLEMACLDILGKHLGVPVYTLLGGRIRDRVRSYTYIYPGPGVHLSLDAFWLRPKDVADRAIAYADAGFTALKLDPLPIATSVRTHAGQVLPLQWPLADLDRAEETIGLLREGLGNRCDIIVGTHGQMTASGAIRLAKRLEKYDPLWLEEPVPPEMHDEMAKVARSTCIPITAGERLTSKWEFARLIRSDAVAICNLDVAQCGGLLEAKKIAALAEANYVQIAPHVYGGPLVAAASIHLSLSCPNFLIMEVNDTYRTGVYQELLDTPLDWSEGYLIPSTRPGLGHGLNEAVARRLAPEEH